MDRPSGTVTFLFTDIEGSTRRWEADPDGMIAALAAHDTVLRSAIERHGGWLFKHTGDGMCAAFTSADSAVDAAVEAQRGLELPVRMGLATGAAQERDGDYFGKVLNRAARTMAVANSGQILLAASTASLLDGAEIVDLGEHRLRDLSGPTRLFQVLAPGLPSEFGPPRTLDAVPGNLPAQPSSFVGREQEVKDLVELVRAHRLVTLTGVGGVGKTRLALQVAAELVGEYPDGVWLVELAPVGDPAAVADVVGSVLRVTPQAGRTMTDALSTALSGRRLLIVLDNCEHVLDAAADLVEAILAGTSTVSVIATSREGLRVAAEHLWPVPSLDLRGGATSAAVELFVERSRAVNPAFDPSSDPALVASVEEICRRLDGIALAIELAAARMVSMNPSEVLDRLTDRFRLLAGSRRGLERHQTLGHTVSWSYDLLEDTERALLRNCSVFADGFDLAAAAALNDGLDEYRVLDGLDSLVRKSLVTTEQVSSHTRYGMLETIRQFAEERLASTGAADHVRDLHAAHCAERAVAHWDIWDGPDQRVALDWLDVELANLRTGFRWAFERGDQAVAATIAAHATMLGWALQRFEPVAWANQVLPAATAARVPHLSRLYAAASVCSYTGNPEAGLPLAQAAVALEADPRYDHFAAGLSRFWEAVAHFYAGRTEVALAIFADLAGQTGLADVLSRNGVTEMLAVLGRTEEASAMADEMLTVARAHANPFFVAWALFNYVLTYARPDPAKALDACALGLAYTREHGVAFWAAHFAEHAARLETVHGDLGRALTLYESAIDSLHQSGNLADLTMVIANVALSFEHIDRPKVAATLCGATHIATTASGLRSGLVARLRALLGDTVFERCAAVGAAMRPAEAVSYMHQQIEVVRRDDLESPC